MVQRQADKMAFRAATKGCTVDACIGGLPVYLMELIYCWTKDSSGEWQRFADVVRGRNLSMFLLLRLLVGTMALGIAFN